MAKVQLKLDPRVRKDGTTAVMLTFIHKRYRRQLSLGITVPVSLWDSTTETLSSESLHHKQINRRIEYVKSGVAIVLQRHYCTDEDGATIFEDLERSVFREKYEARVKAEETVMQSMAESTTLLSVAQRFAELKKRSTRLTYERTIKHLKVFVDRGQSNSLDKVNRAWLTSFDNYLSESNPSANARALHFRNLRAIFNYAIDEELTTNYPFRRFKIKTVETAKRNVSVEELRQIFNYKVEAWQVVYRDMFKLSFMLMGVNFADLLSLTAGAINRGRIEFNRHKTSRLYTIKLEPEITELIEQYSGQEHLLRIMDGRKDYLQFIRQTNHALGAIGTKSFKGHAPQGQALVPGLTTYWARHTWATIASSLDIPKDTIAKCLGHGSKTVTDIYIDYDRHKVDAANRKVLDWVLYGKKDGKIVVKPGTPEFYGLSTAGAKAK